VFSGKRRLRTPTLLQMEAAECGAACLGIILGHFKRWVPLEELRVACGVSRDGSNALNILRAAKQYGLAPDGWRLEPSDLREVPLPFIAHWELNHFVVVEGVSPSWVYLNDPARGPRRVSMEEFDRAFTGIALTFEKKGDFQTGGEQPNALSGLGKRVRGEKKALSFIFLVSLALVVPGLLLPAFSRVFVDYYLIERYESWLEPLLLGMILTAVLQGLLVWLQQREMTRLQTKMAVASAGRFIRHALRLPITFFAQRYAGEIHTRSSLEERLAKMVAGQLGTAGVNLVTIVFYVLIMLQYDVALTLVGVAFALANLFTLGYVSRRLRDQNQAMMAESGKLSAYALQGLQMVETYKAAGTEQVLFSRIAAQHTKTINARQSLDRRRYVLRGVPMALNAISVAAILVLGGMRVMDGELTVGMLVAFQGLMYNFLSPVSGLVSLGEQFQDAQGCLTRVEDVLRQPRDDEFASESEKDGASATGEARKLAGHVVLENITFGYSPLAPPLVQGFSLDVKPGQRVALVGASGSGKSTIAKLVSGLYKPWEGRVLIDGRPIGDIPREILRNSVAVVDQEVVLFEGTIRDNLTMWDGTMAEERLVEAARDADIHDIIAARPGGYNSDLTENGGNLSGGQRAKIELARALALNPSVLILDEATSNLDAITEETVVDRLRRRGCTLILIAHRLSTVRDCDEIIVLEKGIPVERGTHDTLMALGGAYAKLVAA